MTKIEIVTIPLVLDIHGFSGVAPRKDYVQVAFALMDKMWNIVKSKKLPNKGRNIWIYEPGDRMFAGVELEGSEGRETELEHRNLVIERYARSIHVGPYGLISKSGQAMRQELTANGHQIISPYIEIYGHWTNDEAKLETELIMALE